MFIYNAVKIFSFTMSSTSAIQEWLQTSRIPGNLGQLLADLALLVQDRMGGSSGAVCAFTSGSDTKPMLELINYPFTPRTITILLSTPADKNCSVYS